jgi:hypothetical protein
MRLGLIHINMGPMSRPDALVQSALTRADHAPNVLNPRFHGA